MLGLETFARLLSSEGLEVEYSQTSNTAYFDIERRKIILPIYYSVPENVYMLLTSHEVGHALFTKYSISDFRKYTERYKSLFNVIEDAYIEKKIKIEYHGLHSIFNDAYKFLHQNNFFEIEGKNLKEMTLTSRLNLYSKLGNFVDVPFKTTKEVEFSLRMMNLSSNDDVIQLCEDILHYIQEENENSKEQQSDKNQNHTESNQNHTESNDSTEQKEQNEQNDLESDNSPSNDMESNSSIENKEEKEDNSKGNDQTETQEKKEEYENELLDETEEALEKNLEEYEINNKPQIGKNDYIVLNSKIFNKYKFNMAKLVSDNKNSLCFQFNEHNYRTVDVNKIKHKVKLVKSLAKTLETTFKQKRTASQRKNDCNKKTGRINRHELYKYNISTDIFLQRTIHQDGENHGIVILLDYSSSMSMNRHIKFDVSMIQCAVIAEFCHNNNIPFEVIAFGTSLRCTSNEIYKKYGSWKIACSTLADTNNYNLEFLMYLAIHPYCRFNLNRGVTSEINIDDDDDWKSILSTESCVIDVKMSNTPMIESLMCACYTLDKMKRMGIEKTYLYLITDGEYNPSVINEKDNRIYEFPLYEDSLSYMIIDGIRHDKFQSKLELYRKYTLEMIFDHIKKVYGSYICYIFIESYLGKYRISEKVAHQINKEYYEANKTDIPLYWDLTHLDKQLLVYKHGLEFEKVSKLPLLEKDTQKIIYDFTNNPFVDKFMMLNSATLYKLDKKDINTPLIKNQIFKLFASNFIEKIA